MDMQIYRDALTVAWLCGAWHEVEALKARIRQIEPPKLRLVSITIGERDAPWVSNTVEVWE